jgi:hypothetical protein
MTRALARPPHTASAALLLGLFAFVGCPSEGSDPPADTDGPSSSSGLDQATSDTVGDSSADTTAAIPDAPGSGIQIVPGVGIGALQLGDRGDRLLEVAGEPDASLRFGNLVLLTFEAVALEVVVAAPDDEELTPSSKVLSIGALVSETVEFSGPARPGQARDAIHAASGTPQESIEDVDFWEAGWSVAYRSDGSAKVVAVFAPYSLQIDPPEMTPAGG